jgi:hypothetical protein
VCGSSHSPILPRVNLHTATVDRRYLYVGIGSYAISVISVSACLCEHYLGFNFILDFDLKFVNDVVYSIITKTWFREGHLWIVLRKSHVLHYWVIQLLKMWDLLLLSSPQIMKQTKKIPQEVKETNEDLQKIEGYMEMLLENRPRIGLDVV